MDPPSRRHHLPAPASAFVGREEALAELRGVLEGGARLITLTGTGGAGKTRLAVELGRRWLDALPGGACFSDLGEVGSEDELLAAVAAALDTPQPERDAGERLAELIGARGAALFILDNFEHIPHLAAPTVGRWLQRAPEARFLVTARRPLLLPGEVVITVGPLLVPEAGAPLDEIGRNPAVALFLARAQDVSPGFRLTPETAPVVARLVTALDGLPLAIELAAARLRVLQPAALLERLGGRLPLLSSGRRGASQRRTSLRGTLDASWDLLAPWERAALAQLSVLRGAWTAEAAVHVLDLSPWPESPWPRDVLQALVDHGLVHPRARRSGHRYALYAHIAEYAAEKLDLVGSISDAPCLSGPGGRAAAELRHVAHYARAWPPEVLDQIYYRDRRLAREALLDDADNVGEALRRAMARAAGEEAARLAMSQVVVERLRGGGTAIKLAQEAALLPGISPLTLARLHLQLASRHEALGQPTASLQRADAALALARELGDREVEGAALIARSLALGGLARPAEARASWRMTLEVAIETSSRALRAGALHGLAEDALQDGRLDEADLLCAAALKACRELGDDYAESALLNSRAAVALQRGLADEAEKGLLSALEVARASDLPQLEGRIVANLASVALRQGRLHDAERYATRAVEIQRDRGDRRHEGMALTGLVEVHLCQRRWDLALQHADLALGRLTDQEERRGRGVLLGARAEALAYLGRFDRAREDLEAGEAILREIGDEFELARITARRGLRAHLSGDLAGRASALAAMNAVLAGLVPATTSALLNQGDAPGRLLDLVQSEENLLEPLERLRAASAVSKDRI